MSYTGIIHSAPGSIGTNVALWTLVYGCKACHIVVMACLGYPANTQRVPARCCTRVPRTLTHTAPPCISTVVPQTHVRPLRSSGCIRQLRIRAINDRDELYDQPWRWEETDDALRAYGALFSCLLGGSVLPLSGLRFADIGYFTGLAICTIYIGAHRGLSSKMRTTISFKQGLLAPIACSIALFGGYLLIKFVPDLNLSTILNIYFWVLGSVAVSGALTPLARQLVRARLVCH